MANYGGPPQGYDPRYPPRQANLAPAAQGHATQGYEQSTPKAEIAGENIVLESTNAELRVTTHRVRYLLKRTGSTKFVSIMLDAITSCEVTHTSYPALIVIAVLVFLAGIAMNSSRDNSPSLIGAALAVIPSIAYFATRRQVVRISSPSAHIDVLLVGIGFDHAVRVVDAIEAARSARLA